MGFLTEGDTLPWEEAKKWADYIREHGITQFLHLYHRNKARSNETLFWGDEVEYLVVKMDHAEKRARLSLTGDQAIERLDRHDRANPGHSSWKPEYGKFMIEGTPGAPFGESWRDFLELEKNMRERRELMQSVLGENEYGITLPNFPLLGVPDSTSPATQPGGPIANSLYTSDDLIHPHHRFATLTRNIRIRRGSNVAMNIPIYRDEKTVLPTYEAERREGRDAKDGHIYMDSMAFGMGMHCLQCTFQTCNITEARSINDQFTVLAPIMLALTAGTPFFRGMISDCDVRWQVISGAVDDRTPSERGVAPLGSDAGVRVINKSRYDSIDSYLSLDSDLYRPEYDDLKLVYDQKIYDRLIEDGIDDKLAKHLAHLFIRDPLVIYQGKITELDDEKASDHFENIQSTNWQTVRFKPPPPSTPIGWRVEFRPMEIQATDFENAAFVIFIVLLTRILGAVGLNLYLPITKVDENMKRAHERDAVLTQKFYWRKTIVRSKPKTTGCHKPHLSPVMFSYHSPPVSENGDEPAPSGNVDDEYEEMTINEIINGKGDYPGLMTIVTHYCDNVNMDSETRALVDQYLSLVSKRASGELKTFARWQRDFVTSHPDYKKDSIISPSINYDLIQALIDLEAGKRSETSLLGAFWPHLSRPSSSPVTLPNGK